VEALHPVAIHLPIALILLAPIVDALGLFTNSTHLSRLAVGFYVAIVVTALFATATGQAAFDVAVEGGVTGELLNTHADDANLVPWLSIVVVVVRFVAPQKLGRAGRFVALALGVALWPFIYLVGDSGGDLVYQHGIGVRPAAERTTEGAPER
jgi:uncharacterized membrane protein